ncbi:hypothetical protein RJP21_08705 [Paenibacillus sp. VCA1]|nr:hypothetical protein [Paenibacillus sp. VCA1]MDR9853679.1 hypothetical protein [Paenibacillus sp. VCA1]
MQPWRFLVIDKNIIIKTTSGV